MRILSTARLLPAATICYTAPTITEQQALEERQAVDDKERAVYEAQVLGTAAIRFETPVDVERGLVELEQALLELDEAEKASYQLALQLCPDLVATETAPLIFLRCEDFDAKAAAYRLVRHWCFRHRLFGDQRAFLPMIQGGAMFGDDLVYLEAGIGQCLPKDQFGRAVVMLRRGDQELAGLQRGVHNLRSFFYSLHVAAQDELAQKHGVVVVIDRKNADHGSFSRKRVKHFIGFLRSASPLVLRGLHMLYPAIKCEGKLNLECILYLLGKETRQLTRVHSGCPQELMFDLREHGLKEAGIPTTIGGLHCMALVTEWLAMRREHEVRCGGVGATLHPIDIEEDDSQ